MFRDRPIKSPADQATTATGPPALRAARARGIEQQPAEGRVHCATRLIGRRADWRCRPAPRVDAVAQPVMQVSAHEGRAALT
jgi:hypothetical protein